MKERKILIDNTGIGKKLYALGLPQGKSNNTIEAISIIEGFWISIWMGCFKLAILLKLEAGQQGQQMEFVPDIERRKADRRLIETAGIRDAQKILSERLNVFYNKWKSLEVLNK